MIFELTSADDKTQLLFTHEGLTPDRECYTLCSQGWTMILTERLPYYITTGKML
jgi:hypothetical protein